MNQQELKKLLHYDPATGVFVWKTKPAIQIKVGDIAGYKARNGYIQLRTKGKLYYAHRLAVLYMTGVFPTKQIDHIDGNTSNNSWSNLREADAQTNQRNCARGKNNNSGITGVCWESRRKHWIARITVDYQEVHLGSFNNMFDAAIARKAAEQRYGFHPNHGRTKL